METGLEEKKRTAKILEILEREYPDARTALVFNTPYELLVATMLSAQSTDRQVNKITAKLFQRYRRPRDFAALSQEQLEEAIKGCGLFHNKAKNIRAASEKIIKEYSGELPATMEELLQLPGVGRKTANVVLANAFGKPALAVDTHVFRLAHRLGWSAAKTAEQTEKDLCRIIPEEKWNHAHHWLINHGRKICSARNPKCVQCRLIDHCPGCSKD